MRILALDLGKRRIGMAISDELGITAQGLQTLVRTRVREDLARLKQIIDGQQVSLVVVGNPLHMSGDESRQSEYARDFAERLGTYAGVETMLLDERLTTVEAGRVLRESGISSRKRAQAVDRLSAVLILKSYLDSLG